jgi:hypothetical protein
MAHPTSYSRLAPSTWTVLIVRKEDLIACCVLGQLACLAAILEKEMSAGQPHQLPRQEVKVERSLACLPAGCFYTGRRRAEGGSPAAVCRGGLERVSTTTLAALAMWWITNVNSATKDISLHWHAVQG